MAKSTNSSKASGTSKRAVRPTTRNTRQSEIRLSAESTAIIRMEEILQSIKRLLEQYAGAGQDNEIGTDGEGAESDESPRGSRLH